MLIFFFFSLFEYISHRNESHLISSHLVSSRLMTQKNKTSSTGNRSTKPKKSKPKASRPSSSNATGGKGSTGHTRAYINSGMKYFFHKHPDGTMKEFWAQFRRKN